MSNIVLLILLVMGLLFGAVLLFGAPYLPTLKKQSGVALDLLSLKPGQTLVELGSGDGRVMRLAAERGLKVVGYELNPLLVAVSYFVCFKHRKNVRIVWGNFWQRKLPECDGVFVFLLEKYMKNLDTKIIQETSKNVKLVSYAFEIPNKKPIKQMSGMFLYDYKK